MVNDTLTCSLELIGAIKNRLQQHHNLYDSIPVKDIYWECILTKSFNDIGVKCDWICGSHEKGKDIHVGTYVNGRISCKAGILTYLKKTKSITKLKISSFRTTEHLTIEDKLNAIDGDHEDVVYSLSSTLFNKLNVKRYMLTIFKPVQFKSLKWELINNEWRGISSDKYVSASIKVKCSDQLWYDIDYNSPLITDKHIIDLR